MLDTSIPLPLGGRTYSSQRRVRLSDMDAQGRVRLDAIARLLQDIAIDDVQETGWGAPDHLWFVRSIRVDVLRPFLDDHEIELTTWCSGVAAIAAGRRWSVSGDGGGSIEVDSVWIHLGPDARPARIGHGFDEYREASAGRGVSTRLALPEPPADAPRTPWPLRLTDVDLLGHVNNAAYWAAVEHRLRGGRPALDEPLRALLDYRHPLDLGEYVELAEDVRDGRYHAAFCVGRTVKAVVRVESLV